MSDVIVGIDLGTTNSEIAVIETVGATRQVTVIEIARGTRLLPSFVGLADDGGLLVGEAARNQYVVYPERTIKSIKRRMGSTDRVSLGSSEYRPQEISAMILRRLKQIAETSLGVPVNKAVITVPAYFSDAQRQATREAGEIAGLEVARMINEPTAAALAYGAGQQQQQRILVYDLGGGTFDVSVVAVDNGVIEVLASHGDNQLGGDDFDAKLVEYLVEHLRESGIDGPLPERAMATIARAAERAKIELSDRAFTQIEEEYLFEHNGVAVNLSLEIARSDYEALIEPYIEQTLDAVHTALNGAQLGVNDIDEVLLVGGSSRTPIITERLRDDLGLEVRTDIDPELCVATGAAIQAAMLAGTPVENAVLVDVTPYTFGTSAFGELNGMPYPYVFAPVIFKNTPIPVTKSEVFFTMQDGQSAVNVQIYQGEEPDALDNILIGSFHVSNLSDVPAGNAIVLQLALNTDGILQVSAREKRTGLEKSITIDNALDESQRDQLDSARDRIEALFDDEAPPPLLSAPGSGVDRRAAHDSIAKAQTLLDRVDGDDREDLIDAIESLTDALSGDDDDAIGEAQEALGELLFYLDS